jgi:RHS repeat-associated protein
MEMSPRDDSAASVSSLLRGRRAPGAALVAVMLWVAVPAAGKTIDTDYTYNTDGALTAIATSVDGGDSTTEYLTWDDFVPDESDPSTGTVGIGNGRLVGRGPKPGVANATERFEFDPRDRLLTYSSDSSEETYDYHAGGMMASSSAEGDSLRFYYDTSPNPQATNLHQEQTDLWSGYLGGVRYLSDGTEQTLLRPRKDTTATYDAATGTVQSYAYDAYGAQPSNPPSGTYDLQANPFQYAGEYRSPMWGGTYLRARWYDPDLPGFISRDPVANLNRYAYAGANPVMNVDPSGESYKSAVGNPLGHFLQKLNSGVGGHFARIFLAPLIGPLQILADPGSFWGAVKHNRDGIDIFLAAGIASEVGGGVVDFALAGVVRLGTRFAARTASDLTIGVSSSIGAGASRGFRHFDWNAFGQGLELSLNPLLTRGATGLNVRSGFQLSTEDLAAFADKLDKMPEATALVFRQKTDIEISVVSGAELKASLEPPLLQALHVGNYHERLIAFTKDEFFLNDAIGKGLRLSREDVDDLAGVKAAIMRQTGKFEFVGEVTDFISRDKQKAFFANPWKVRVEKNESYIPVEELQTRVLKARKYGQFTNNCQHHAYAVLQDLGLR